jgi:DNA-binding GntR family transcriptional regulator
MRRCPRESATYPAPGTRLHIGMLAGDFGTARDTVAHAMRMLEAEGKAERFPGLGWYVTDG